MRDSKILCCIDRRYHDDHCSAKALARHCCRSDEIHSSLIGRRSQKATAKEGWVPDSWYGRRSIVNRVPRYRTAQPSHKTLPLLDEQKVGMDSSNASLKTLNVDQVRSMNCWHATLASGWLVGTSTSSIISMVRCGCDGVECWWVIEKVSEWWCRTITKRSKTSTHN